jgi:hypothetical protein
MSFYNQYQAKRQEIEQSRLNAFSSVGLASRIGSYIVRSLTARAWIDLRVVKNGILSGKLSEFAVCQYIFRNHVNYPLSNWQKFKIERKIAKVFRTGQDADQFAEDINEHLNSAFYEMPESASNRTTTSFKLPEVEGIVGAIDELAARYGQHPDDIADMPMTKIFALQKAGRLSTIPNYKILEPKVLRDLKSEALKAKREAKENG